MKRKKEYRAEDGLPFAEDVNYWQTGHSSPDVWLARATMQIEAIGGSVLGEGFGRDRTGRAAYQRDWSSWESGKFDKWHQDRNRETVTGESGCTYGD